MDSTTPDPEVFAQLDEALLKLPKRDREILVAHHFEGHGFREIAVIHGMKEAAARKRASRATERLGKMLGGGAAAMKSAGAMTLPALSPKAVATTAMACAPPIALLSFAALAASQKVKIAAATALVALVPLALQWRKADHLSGKNAALQAKLSILTAPSAPVPVAPPTEATPPDPGQGRESLVEQLNRALIENREEDPALVPATIVEAAERVGAFKLRTFLFAERYNSNVPDQDTEEFLEYAKELESIQSEATHLMLSSRYIDQLTSMESDEIATLMTTMVTRSLALEPAQAQTVLAATSVAYDAAFKEHLFTEEYPDKKFPEGFYERRAELTAQTRKQIISAMDPGTAQIFRELWPDNFLFGLQLSYQIPHLQSPPEPLEGSYREKASGEQ